VKIETVDTKYYQGMSFRVPFDRKVWKLGKKERDAWAVQWLKRKKFKVREITYLVKVYDKEANLTMMKIVTKDFKGSS